MPAPAIATVDCLVCGALFSARAADVRRGHAKYCSRGCAGEATRRRLLSQSAVDGTYATCAQCGSSFRRAPSKIARVKHRVCFCSRACKDAAQSLAGRVPSIRPPHYGTATLSDRPDHYRRVAFAHYPRQCARCGWDAHPAVLVVHHRNRDRSDSRVENLEVLCPTCHEVEHFARRDGRFAGHDVAQVPARLPE